MKMPRVLPVRAFLLFAAVSIPLAAQGQAPRQTGNDLLTGCKAAERYINGDRSGSPGDVSFCTTYLSGFRDAIAFASGQPGATVCIPHQVSGSQLVRVYVRWAETHPERLHEDIASTTLWAFSAAFPCAAPAAGS